MQWMKTHDGFRSGKRFADLQGKGGDHEGPCGLLRGPTFQHFADGGHKGLKRHHCAEMLGSQCVH